MQDVFIRYGAWGGAVLGLSAFILILINWLKKKDDDHRSAVDKINEENRKLIEKIFDKNIDQSEANNKVLRDVTNILVGLKSLLENQNRR